MPYYHISIKMLQKCNPELQDERYPLKRSKMRPPRCVGGRAGAFLQILASHSANELRRAPVGDLHYLVLGLREDSGIQPDRACVAGGLTQASKSDHVRERDLVRCRVSLEKCNSVPYRGIGVAKRPTSARGGLMGGRFSGRSL